MGVHLTIAEAHKLKLIPKPVSVKDIVWSGQ